MRKGERVITVELTEVQLSELEELARQSRCCRHEAFRASLVLKCAQGLTDGEVARGLRTSRPTVRKWRQRYVERGLDGLRDEPRPGAPRQVGDEQIAEVVTQTLETRPAGATHWSTRGLAAKLALSQSTISRIWRSFGLKPHQSEGFTLSNDPFLVEKVRDVVGLYHSPPVNALVLCVDEKSRIQALERTQPVMPQLLGQPERRTPDYVRHGTTTLFAALNIATGEVIGKCFPKHRAVEFRAFLDLIDKNVPDDPTLQIHLVLDNYSTHKTDLIRDWLLRHPRYHLHFTPTHASWLNQVERWFALLTTRQIKRGSHHHVHQLIAAIYEFMDQHNLNPKPFIWRKTADEILNSIKRYATRALQVISPLHEESLQ